MIIDTGSTTFVADFDARGHVGVQPMQTIGGE